MNTITRLKFTGNRAKKLLSEKIGKSWTCSRNINTHFRIKRATSPKGRPCFENQAEVCIDPLAGQITIEYFDC